MSLKKKTRLGDNNNRSQFSSLHTLPMNGWKSADLVCDSCLKAHDTTSEIIPHCRMITHTTHSAPLKTSQHLNGCHNGHHLTNSHYHQNIDVVNNHKNIDTLNYDEKKSLDIMSQNTKNLEESMNHNNQTMDSIKQDPNKIYFKPGFEACSCCDLKVPSNGKSNESVSEGLNEDEDEDEREDNSCGLWSFRPQWLQQFANKKAFLVVFCLTSVLQGMYYTYFVSVLTTIEKLYQIQSKWTGIIMSATEMGQIFGALLLTYYGGQGHRPKWIAYGMFVFAIAAVLCAAPHFLFQEVIAPARTASKDNSTERALSDLRTRLCSADFSDKSELLLASSTGRPILNTATVGHSLHTNTALPALPNIEASTFMGNLLGLENNLPSEIFLISLENTTLTMSQHPRSDPYTDAKKKCEIMNESGLQDKITEWVLGIFFVSLLFIGIGATAVYTLGIPYIDDNVATKESPMYFGITIGVRIFGPVFGFLLGSYCTSLYVNFPLESTDMTPDDPQWIGAWWFGVFLVGGALILITFPMMAFPKKLPKPPHVLENARRKAIKKLTTSPTNNDNGVLGKTNQCHSRSLSDCQSLRSTSKKPMLKDFPTAIRRLLRNDILLLRTASSVLHILPIAGLYTFLPKYLESQFQLTATMANMIAGLAGILVMGVGIFASGMYMRKNKPNARFVAGWIAMAALAYAIGMVILMWLGCPLNKYVGLNAGSGDAVALGQKNCNSTCDCKTGEFAPICTSHNITYLSPCLAGCTVVTSSEKDHFVYKDCHCLEPNVTAVNGFCPLQCNNLVWYVLIFSAFVLIHSTSEVGSMLLTLRCVDPQDKAMALGLISFAIGLFGNVPCPIIYGAVVDSACLFWEDNCGEPGACRLYDPSKFRMVFHGVTAVIMFCAFLVDAVVWYKAKAIQFSSEEEHEEEEAFAGSEEARPFNPTKNNTSNFESSV